MRTGLTLTTALALATPLMADPPAVTGTQLTPQAFETFATGKTFAYAQDGVIWGRETYLPGRRVMWRAVGEDCQIGHWQAEDMAVCFTYDNQPNAQCWAFSLGASGLIAHFLNDPASPPAYASEEPGAIACPGPEIGS
jgi:hypothetical protein